MQYEKLEKHLHDDVHHAAVILTEAMDVALICFAFPIRTLLVLIFAKKTGRHFQFFNFTTIADYFLFTGVLAWFIKYEILIHEPVDESHGFNHLETMMWNLLESIEDNSFRFDVLLAVVSAMFW